MPSPTPATAWSHVVATTLVFAVAGCTSEPVQLLDNTAWSPVPESDPRAGADCSDLAFGLEGSALEIDTEGCSPVAVELALADDIRAGDLLEIVWWHDWLTYPEPVDGTFTLSVDEGVLYERIEPIPGGPAAYTEQFEAPVTAGAGQRLMLTVDNHGANTWNLLRLTRL